MGTFTPRHVISHRCKPSHSYTNYTFDDYRKLNTPHQACCASVYFRHWRVRNSFPLASPNLIVYSNNIVREVRANACVRLCVVLVRARWKAGNSVSQLQIECKWLHKAPTPHASATHARTPCTLSRTQTSARNEHNEQASCM